MGFGTVFHWATTEIVALHRTCKAFAAADTAYVNQISGCEYVGFDYVSRFLVGLSVQSLFPDKFSTSNTCFCEITLTRFGHFPFA